MAADSPNSANAISPSLVIRRLKASNIDSKTVADLVCVWRSARAGALQFLLDLHTADEDREYFTNVILAESEVWVAEIDRQIAGFIAFAHGWVHHLYLDPRFHRRGIGGRLLSVAQNDAGRLQLWAFESNAQAIDFYQRRGFTIVERTDGATNEARQPDVRLEWTAKS